MKKASIITLIILTSFLLSASLFLAKNKASAQVEPPPSVPVPFADITLDGNPSDWSSIATVFTDFESDDPTGFTGADIKSFKFAQDSDYVYVTVDFYDGPPSIALGQADYFAYQFHFAIAGTSGGPLENFIDSIGAFYDGSKWDLNYISEFAPVSGELTGSSVAVDSVIELAVPKNKLPNSFDFTFQIGSGDVSGNEIGLWATLSLMPERILPDEAVKLIKEVIQADYLWGGKGFNPFALVKKFLDSSTVKDIGYDYWNPEKRKKDFGRGLDCSGLSFWSYNRAYYGERELSVEEFKNRPLFYEGVWGQHDYNTKRISKEELKGGDLLFFFERHVAMYIEPFVYEGKTYNTIHSSGFTNTITFASYDYDTEELITIKPTGESQVLEVKDYGRVIEPQKEGEIRAKSTIDLIVTDPDGLIITSETREIPGMEYQQYDINGDSDLDDIVVIGERKIGNYLITIVPEPDTLPTDTYTLEFEALINGELVIIVLAEDVPISEIPTEGYGIRSTEAAIEKILSTKLVYTGDTSGQYSDTVNLSAILTDEYDNTLSDKTITFEISEQSISATTGESGKAEVSWQVDLIPKELLETYPIIVTFAGDEYYLSSQSLAEFTLKSAKWLKVASIEKLEQAKTGKKILDRKINAVIELLERILDVQLWEDASRLKTDFFDHCSWYETKADDLDGLDSFFSRCLEKKKRLYPFSVFTGEHRAIKHLQLLMKFKGFIPSGISPESEEIFKEVINNLTKADELIAQVAIEDTEKLEVINLKLEKIIKKLIEKAKKELQSGQQLSQTEPDKAVIHYRQAWFYAKLAEKLAKWTGEKLLKFDGKFWSEFKEPAIKRLSYFMSLF